MLAHDFVVKQRAKNNELIKELMEENDRLFTFLRFRKDMIAKHPDRWEQEERELKDEFEVFSALKVAKG